MTNFSTPLSWPANMTNGCFQSPGLKTRIASDPDMDSERKLFEHVLSTYVPAYAALFDSAGVSSPLIIALPGSFWGGGVMGRTISLTHGGELTPAIEPMVGYIVGHEVYHLWNAQWRYDERNEAEVEWVKEGSAEYYTWLTGVRTNDLPVEALLGQIAERWAAYRNALREVSIASAGRTKHEDSASYDLVYSGGMMLALALDMTIRQETDGQYSLDDVIKAIHAEYAEDGAGSLSITALNKTIYASTGVRTGAFFRKYLQNAQIIPMQELLRHTGICLSESIDEGTVTASAELCAEENQTASAVREIWLSGS